MAASAVVGPESWEYDVLAAAERCVCRVDQSDQKVLLKHVTEKTGGARPAHGEEDVSLVFSCCVVEAEESGCTHVQASIVKLVRSAPRMHLLAIYFLLISIYARFFHQR